MLETAIIGGGLTGLSLARSLEREGFDYALFEARERLGGRILSRSWPDGSLSVDLGAAWYWPETQPRIAALMEELGLESFPQYDDGTVWVLTDADRKPHKLENQTLHGGAVRVSGGMTQAVVRLAGRLTSRRLALSHVLTSVRDCGSHVELCFDTHDGEAEIAASCAVLAMPPRLIEEHILFSPALPEELERRLLACPTWMAQQAKAIVVYGDMPNFRDQVGSGNAFVHHEQAMLGEVFDAGGADGSVRALGGFLSLSPAQRGRFCEGMEMLVTSQFSQLFGPAFQGGRLEYQDWASERFTCASSDRREPAASHPKSGDPGLHPSLWNGKLRFAGSEFALEHAGYLEGALMDAERVAQALVREHQLMSELYAICRTADIGEGQAVGFVLARAQKTGAARPWPILVTRKGNQFYGFENACPHQGAPLDRTPGQFLDEDGNFLTCGWHRAQFDLDTGHCFIGPCQGQRLTSVNLVIDDGDVCVSGVQLAEEDGMDLADPDDSMPEVMIQPD